MRRFLLLSLALHLILAMFFLARWSSKKAVLTEPSAVMVELEMPSQTSPSPSVSKINKHATAPQQRASAPSTSFSSLAPVHKPNLTPVRPGQLRIGSTEMDSLSPYAASDDAFSKVPKEGTGALTWVYRKAQLTIGYPGEFVRNNIHGQTQARLVFDDSGKFRAELLSVRSDSPYLRVYVHRMLERTFGSEPIPANLVRWKNDLEILCFVQFSFAEFETSVSITSPNPIVGNKLFFARKTFKSSLEKLKWEVGPLHGVFPVPAVGLDMLWFAKKIEDAKHPLRAAAEADELAQYRKDQLFYN